MWLGPSPLRSVVGCYVATLLSYFTWGAAAESSCITHRTARNRNGCGWWKQRKGYWIFEAWCRQR